MIQRMRDNPAATVAAGFGVSLRTARKWMKRYREGGLASLADASSRPRHCRNRLTELDVSRIFELRKKRQTGDAIALRLGLCRSTVFRALRRLGCSRLSSLEEKEPVQRYQWAKPGQMLHLDIKRLGKIDGVGHRKTGTRQVRRRRPGWEYLHSALKFMALAFGMNTSRTCCRTPAGWSTTCPIWCLPCSRCCRLYCSRGMRYDGASGLLSVESISGILFNYCAQTMAFPALLTIVNNSRVTWVNVTFP